MTDLFPVFARIVKQYQQSALDAALTREQKELGLTLVDNGLSYSLCLKGEAIEELPKNKYFTYDDIRAVAEQRLGELTNGVTFERSV